MTFIELRYGKGTVEADIPDENFAGIVEPKELPPLEDEKRAIREALENPIGTPRLRDIASDGDRVAIIASDITRPSPSYKLLPPLLDELNQGGVPDEDITVVMALGIHRPHTDEERRELVGDEVYERVRCIDHDPEDCVQVAVTDNGTRIQVFREVVESDVVVCTGNIEYHYFAGYSGGAKAVMPGVCSKTSIQDNHKMMTHEHAYASNLDSPVREDMDDVGRVLPVDFILNVVLDAKKRMVDVVAGHYLDAHRRGCETVDQMLKVDVDPADIVITCPGGAPKDINVYQAQKAIDNAKGAVKDGGTIILVAECAEGMGEDVFEEWVADAQEPEDLVERLEDEFVLGGHKAAAIALVLRRAEIMSVSAMPKEMAQSLFFTPVDTLQEAVDRALDKYGSDARVLVMPYGGSTLPIAR